MPSWFRPISRSRNSRPNDQPGGGVKFLPLLWAGLWRKPTRTTLTLLSIVVAFILFGILSGIDAGFAHALEASRLDRLFTDPRFGAPMNISYAAQIARVPGVALVAPRRGLYGYYQDPKNDMGVICIASQESRHVIWQVRRYTGSENVCLCKRGDDTVQSQRLVQRTRLDSAALDVGRDVILKVCTNPAERCPHLDAVPAKLVRIANAR